LFFVKNLNCYNIQLFSPYGTRSQVVISAREDKNSSSTFILSLKILCNYLKSPKPGELHHLSFFAEHNFFDQSKGAWFTMMEEAFGESDLDWSHSNFSQNALIST
jgi:hypothetical protein